jgi:hypothetical protein
MLLISHFLHHLIHFSDSTPKWIIQLSSDNDPLLKWIKANQIHQDCFPNTILEAAWTLQKLPCITHIVKGHQDDKINYGVLPALDAQLNCETVYLQTIHAIFWPHHIPTIKAQLHIAGHANINSGPSKSSRMQQPTQPSENTPKHVTHGMTPPLRPSVTSHTIGCSNTWPHNTCSMSNYVKTFFPLQNRWANAIQETPLPVSFSNTT